MPSLVLDMSSPMLRLSRLRLGGDLIIILTLFGQWLWLFCLIGLLGALDGSYDHASGFTPFVWLPPSQPQLSAWPPLMSGTRLESSASQRCGVLSLDPPPALTKAFKWCQSYIPASYIKFIEMAGGRVVPIFIDRNEDYYERVFNNTNGLLIPGGGLPLQNLNETGYGRAGKVLYEMAVKANQNNDFYPIWGTCLGAEFLSIVLDPKETYRLTPCLANNLSLPLKMSDDIKKSRLLENVPADVFTFLTTLNVTANFHQKCLTPDTVKKSGLNNVLNVLSTSKDRNSTEFVSIFEAINYPFYGVQWHPEKSVFEWTMKEELPHTYEAVRVAQHFANFFVGEARKSTHKFPDEKQEEHALIYNQKTHYTPTVNILFTEVYMFKNSTKAFYLWNRTDTAGSSA